MQHREKNIMSARRALVNWSNVRMKKLKFDRSKASNFDSIFTLKKLNICYKIQNIYTKSDECLYVIVVTILLKVGFKRTQREIQKKG